MPGLEKSTKSTDHEHVPEGSPTRAARKTYACWEIDGPCVPEEKVTCHKNRKPLDTRREEDREKRAAKDNTGQNSRD